MNKSGTIALLALPAIAALLVACAGTPETAGPTAAPNSFACPAFGQVTFALTDRMVAGSDASNGEEFKTTMASFVGKFDAVGLGAEGEVAERIQTLIDDLPDPVHMLFLYHDQYFEDVAAVDRACESEGFKTGSTLWESTPAQ